MAPTISWWDSSEFVTAAWCWGIPHPPGNLLYVTIARLFTMLFSKPDSIAKSVNFLSVLSTSLSSIFIFFYFENLLGIKSIYKKFLLSTSVVCSFLVFSVWDSAVETEIYGLTLLIISIILYLSNLIFDGKKKYLYLMVYIFALSVSIHPLPLILIIPLCLTSIIVVINKIKKRKKLSVNPKMIFLLLIIIIIGLSSILIMFYRAQLNPLLNESGIENFKDIKNVLLRNQYGSTSLFVRQTSVQTGYSFIKALFFQIGSYFNYITWQYLPFVRMDIFGIIGKFITGIFSMIIFLFFIRSSILLMKLKNSKKIKIFYILIVFITLSIILLFIFNFKFCASDPDPNHIPKEPRPRDYFFSASFLLLLLISSVYFIKSENKYINFIPTVLIPILLINGFIGHPNRRDNFLPSSYSYNILKTTQGKSIVFVHGDNDTFPLWFQQIVANYRIFCSKSGDRTVIINLTLLNAPWYIKQISDLMELELSNIFHTERRENWDNPSIDFEKYCRENPQWVRTEEGLLLTPGEAVFRCILCKIFSLKCDIEIITLSDSAFFGLLSNAKSDWNIYTTATIALLSDNLVREGLLLKWKGSVKRGIYMLEDYNWSGIIDRSFLDSSGKIIDFGNVKLSSSLLRDVDSRGMSSFYIKAIESVSNDCYKFDRILNNLKELQEGR